MKILVRPNFGIAAADLKLYVHYLYHHCLSGLKVFREQEVAAMCQGGPHTFGNTLLV
jgi:hypothetical protein